MKKIFLAIIILTSFVILSGCDNKEKDVNNNEKVLNNTSLKEGEHYTILKDKLDVGLESPHIVEFFWFGCGHCQTFSGIVQDLEKRLGDNATIYKVAAVTPNWRRDAQVYYTFVEMGVEKEAFKPTIDFYQYIGQTKRALPTMEEIKTHIENIGIDSSEFMTVFNSKNVSERMKEGESLFRKAKLTGVPAFVVNGTHSIELKGLSTYEDLINKSRILLLNVEPKMSN